MERCEECGFVYADHPPRDLPASVRRYPARYRAALGAIDDVRRRPSPDVWSPLEYTCHVRDVLRIQRDRVALALAVDEPAFEPMRREERVVEDRYNEQEPGMVLDELADAAELLAAALERLEPDQWRRRGVYNWPVRQPRTLEWVAQNTVHEEEHHLRDVVAGGRAS